MIGQRETIKKGLMQAKMGEFVAIRPINAKKRENNRSFELPKNENQRTIRCTIMEKNRNVYRERPSQRMKEKYMKPIPNILTVIRMLLIPVFVYAYYHPGLWLPGRMLAMVIFVTASLTDLLDGHIARKYNAISNFGRLFDPVADKLMTISALVCFVESGIVPWTFAALVIGKELLMVLGAYVMLKFHVVVYSKLCGKLATFVICVAIVLTFFEDVYPWNMYLLYVGLVLTFYALFSYARMAIKQIKEIKEHPDHPRDIYSEGH